MAAGCIEGASSTISGGNYSKIVSAMVEDGPLTWQASPLIKLSRMQTLEDFRSPTEPHSCKDPHSYCKSWATKGR